MIWWLNAIAFGSGPISSHNVFKIPSSLVHQPMRTAHMRSLEINVPVLVCILGKVKVSIQMNLRNAVILVGCYWVGSWEVLRTVNEKACAFVV